MTPEEKQRQLDEYFAWRDRMRRRHRTMTQREYRAWLAAGDELSHPSQGNAFPGGLTITLDEQGGIFGVVEGFEPPPRMEDTL